MLNSLDLPDALENCADDVAAVEEGERDEEQVEGVAQVAPRQDHAEQNVAWEREERIYVKIFKAAAWDL